MRDIRTTRLIMKPIGLSDAEELHRVWTHSAVRRYLWDDRVLELQETQDAIETSNKTFASRGFGLWAARLDPKRQMVGFGGFWCFRDAPEPELFYAIAEDFRGIGLATEMAKGFMAYGFRDLGFAEIRASTDVANVDSLRVLERLGMRFERRAIVHGLDTLYYQSERSEASR